MGTPPRPDAGRADELLGLLAELVARGGGTPLLLPPVVPGAMAFPEPWRPTRGGVHALLRRLAWHAANPREIVVLDERLGAPPTERKPATRVTLARIDATTLVFRLGLLAEDDVAGTLAFELGIAHAALNRPRTAEPYREAERAEIEIDPERDVELGAVATVYLGLGVLATNAAFQQYSRPGRFNGGYSPLEYDVLRAGGLAMSELAYLMAVQAVVRGAAMARGPTLPTGLMAPQRDETSAWMAVLAPRAEALCVRLGVEALAAPAARPAIQPLDDVDVDDEPLEARNAFRWRTNRGGMGFLAGAVIGLGVAAAVASHGAAPWLVLGAAGSGHVMGRRIRVPRCSACASVVKAGAEACTSCGARLRGDIDSLADRLEAEEQLPEA